MTPSAPVVQVWRGDITTIGVDAIVNAANTDLAPGGGVCGAIFDAAGREPLAEACRGLGGCATGSAVATPSFGLDRLGVKHIIHAVGPIWDESSPGRCDELLAGAYRSALAVAEELGATSIAFPSISTGIYCYPRRRAAAIAALAVTAYRGDLQRIVLVAFDETSERILSEAVAMATSHR